MKLFKFTPSEIPYYLFRVKSKDPNFIYQFGWIETTIDRYPFLAVSSLPSIKCYGDIIDEID